MTFEQIENAIRKRFCERVGIGRTVIYDNSGQLSPTFPVDHWMRVSIKFGEKEQVSLGANKRFRVVGVLFVQIFVQLATGTQSSLSLASLIEEPFRSKTVESVTYRAPSVMHIGNSEGYWQTNVQCPFYADDLEA